MQVDLEDDRFDVTYDPKRIAVADLLGAIRKHDYKPVVVERTASSGTTEVGSVDTAKLPAELAELFAEARKANKTVLVRFSGPG